VSLVLDVTAHPAVYATRLLVEAGHSVIRIEPRAGDELRRMRPFLGDQPDLENGAYHQFFNAGKRSLTLDPSTSDGRAILLRLAGKAAAVLASEPLPVDEQALMEANPALVLATMDQDEPELCAYARSGLLAITGTPGQEPALLGSHMAYAAIGLYLATATAAAMLAAEQTGQGQRVRVSSADALGCFAEQSVVGWLAMGAVTERRGYRGAITAVSGGFPCLDGYWMVSLPHSAEGWARLMDWVQDPELAADPALADESERLKKRDFILDRLTQWSKRFPKEELVVEAQKRHIPASPVATALELAEDPQLTARGFLRQVDLPGLGTMTFPAGAIATVLETPMAPAPRLGADNHAILGELGYTTAEIGALLQSGAI